MLTFFPHAHSWQPSLIQSISSFSLLSFLKACKVDGKFPPAHFKSSFILLTLWHYFHQKMYYPEIKMLLYFAIATISLWTSFVCNRPTEQIQIMVWMWQLNGHLFSANSLSVFVVLNVSLWHNLIHRHLYWFCGRTAWTDWNVWKVTTVFLVICSWRKLRPLETFFSPQ